MISLFQIPIFQFSHLFWNQTLLIFLLYVRVHLPFIWKTSFCMGLIFRKLWGFLFAFLNKFTTFKYLTIPSLSLCTVFDVISSNTDEIISFNPSANLFVFEGFKVHHHSWQRIPTCPLFYKASPFSNFVKPLLQPTTYIPIAHIITLFLCLNGWSCHIWCYSTYWYYGSTYVKPWYHSTKRIL